MPFTRAPSPPRCCSYFDGDTCHWLLREMEDNRNKSLALSKAYSYPDLRCGRLGAASCGRWLAAQAG